MNHIDFLELFPIYNNPSIYAIAHSNSNLDLPIREKNINRILRDLCRHLSHAALLHQPNNPEAQRPQRLQQEDPLSVLLPRECNALLTQYILAHVAFKHINPILSQGSPIVLMYLINKYFGDVVVMGLTGGIACGKSTLVDGLKRKFDLQIIDCDEISRTVSLPGEKGYNFILNALGDQKNEFIERATGMIKRDKLGELTFRDREFRNKLTKGLGKFIFIEIAKRLLKAVLTGHKFILIDAPILF